MQRRLSLPALFTGFALVMVRPTRPDRIPDNLGDPGLMIWIMSWVGHGLVSQPTRLFDAPMLWPNGSTLAHSDVLATPALPFWALYTATGSWTASYIGVSLLFTVLAETGAYLAALRVTGRRDAGIVAAIAFAFGAYAFSRWASLQLNSLGILALCMVAFLYLLDQPSARRGALLGLATVATFYASAYYGALMLLLLAMLAPAVLVGRAFRRHPSTLRLLACLTLAGLVAAIAILPNALVGFRLQNELRMKRPLSPVYDLRPSDLLRPAKGSYVWSKIEPPEPAAVHEHRFFPGAVAFLLVGTGAIAVGFRLARRRPVGPRDRPDAARDLALFAAAGAVSVLLATGSTGIGPVAPWKVVYSHLPGFAGMRATSRLAVPALLAGAVFAAVGYAAITQRLRARPRLRFGALALCAALMLLELSAPRVWTPLDTSDSRLAVYRALNDRPPAPVLELPMPDPAVEPLVWVYQETPRLVYSTLDWRPRVNGYSGYLPPTYLEDRAAYRFFPDPVALDRLRLRRVRYVILHVGDENGFPAFTDVDADDRLRRLPTGATTTREGSSHLVDLGPPAPQP